MNKKQLQQRLDRNTKKLDRNTKKLKYAEKKVTATQKKLLTTKEHCKQLASRALERRKDVRLAFLNAEIKEGAIREELGHVQLELGYVQKELGHAQRRIKDITADACDRIIEERASNTAQAKSEETSVQKRHQKELN